MVASAFDVDAYLEVETESTYEVTEVYLIYGVAGVEYTYLYRLLDMSLSCEACLAALSPTLRAAAGACTPCRAGRVHACTTDAAARTGDSHYPCL